MSTRTRLLVIAVVYAIGFVIYVTLGGLSVWTALLITAVTFAITSMINGRPRMPPRRRKRAG